MVKAHRIEAWDHTSFIVSKIHNVNCTKKPQMVTPEQLNPYRPKPKKKGPDRKVLRVILANLNAKQAAKGNLPERR